MAEEAWVEALKYTIFSIDDSRKHYTDAIKRELSNWEQVKTECVNGSVPEQLARAQERHPYSVNFLPEYGVPKVGHLGIWYTVLNSLEHAPHVTFEDDAMLSMGFTLAFKTRYQQIPGDADFFSLFLPRDSDHMYNESMSVSTSLTRVYQRYGGVSMYYTPQGADKIRKLLERDGITGQYDDTLYRYAKAGELNGYCSKPTVNDLVYITGEEASIVQETRDYE